jgi:release factor glutamine methyltransferase
MTVNEALAEARRRLEKAGVPAPAWDAERLLRRVLGVDRATLFAGGGEAVPEPALGELQGLVEQRASRRPLQHIVGTVEFFGLELAVGPGALIPRPETELLVEAALAELEGEERPRIADVGTGSGNIALALASARGDARVHATDTSDAALSLARQNAARLRLQDRVIFHHGDLLAPLLALGQPIHLVVSNPPYVDPAELDGLAPEVRDHEPREALVAPDGPYGPYRRLVQQAYPLLVPGGTLLVEIGQGMSTGVVRLFETGGFQVLRVLPDLQSIPRVVVARRT